MLLKDLIIDGELVIKTLAMPAYTNPNGDIFGGWVLSQMDLGGAILAKRYSNSGRVATVAIESMSFINSIQVGDVVSCYAKIIKSGRTSMQVQIQTWTYSFHSNQAKHVTQGLFTYVAIDEVGKPIVLKPIES